MYVMRHAPHIPRDILPFRYTTREIKGAILYLECKYDTVIPVTREDGKSLPPKKRDYELALSNFHPPAFPDDVLLTVLSYHFAPTSLHLLSKHITRLVDTEDFYYRVCTNAGYTDVQGSCKKFYLENIDISKLWNKVTYEPTKPYVKVVLKDKNMIWVRIIWVNTDTITYGQAHNLLSNQRWYTFSVDVPRNPCTVVDIQGMKTILYFNQS